MPYSNPLVGGTALIRRAINSPNYVIGTTGWSINADGTSEFNAGTFRGQIIIGTALHGATIGGTVPAPLLTFYAPANLTQFTIRLFPGDGAYHYELIGIDGGGTDFWAAGWVTISGEVIEHYNQSQFSGGGLFNTFGGRIAANEQATWNFGAGSGAAKVTANIMQIWDTIVAIGVASGDIGSLICNVAASFLNGVGVSGGLSVNSGLFQTTGNGSIGGNLVVNGTLDVPGGFTDIIAGSFSITPAAGVSSSVAVTFPVNLPAGKTYFVVTTANTSVSCQTGTSGISRTGFTGWLTRATATLTNIDYIAMAV